MHNKAQNANKMWALPAEQYSKKHKVKSHKNPKNLERRTKNQANSKENKLDSMKGKWRSNSKDQQ